MNKVAVIILNWNGEKLLREYLPSVIETTDTSIADIIVADNGSTDSSIELLRDKFPQVTLLKFSENYGFAEGYNRAIKETNYPYTILLNSDVATTPGWVNHLYEYMETHPEVGACQPKIRAYTNMSHFEYAGAAGGFIDRNGYPYCRGRIFDSVEEDNGQYDSVMPIFWATGAALMVRSELYLKVGGLDKDFFAHMEEIDLCWRILLEGYDIVAVPQSMVFHLGGGSLPASNPRKTYLNFRNNLLMLHKNLPDSTRGKTLFVRRLLDTIAWAKFMATFDFKNANAILKAHRDFKKMRKAYTSHPNIDLLRTRKDCQRNILIDYYLRSKRTWDKLS
ncbi:MAG: glycosyltransferase family 2 protein [Muribaculaceae bacterium]|nr:glycosyltransferase family 2 protein [Muribaculaceae bacterium]